MAKAILENNGKTWGITANYTDARGKYQRKYKGGFETRAKATKWATAYVNAMKSAVLIDQNLRVQEIIEKLLYEKEFVDKRAQSTMKFYEENFAIISAEFGALFPRKILPVHLQDFVNSFVSTPRKCKAVYQCLSILFNYMERLDLIDRNPFKKIVCPEYTAKETSHYDLKTYKKLLQYLGETDDCIFTPVLIMGTLGLRPSEVLALREEDLQGDFLFVHTAATTVKRKNKKQTIYFGKTKTDKSTRSFTLDENIKEKILQYKRRHEIVSPFLCVQPDGELITYDILKII